MGTTQRKASAASSAPKMGYKARAAINRLYSHPGVDVKMNRDGTYFATIETFSEEENRVIRKNLQTAGFHRGESNGIHGWVRDAR